MSAVKGWPHALLKKAFPIWQKTHVAIEGQVASVEPDTLRAVLRTMA